MATIYQGTTAEVEVSVVTKENIFHLKDSTTDFKVEFYIRGTRNKEGATVVTLQKSDLFFVDDSLDTFQAHVPTENLKGKLACTITGTYRDDHKKGSANIDLPFVLSIGSDINIVEAYL